MTTSKPYLRAIDASPGRTAAALELAHYLGTTFGTGGALDALQYYQRMGWITDIARRELVSYVEGLSLGEIHNKKYDEPGTLTGSLASLSGTAFGAHARSLEYVAALAGDDLEGEVMLARMAEHRVTRESDNSTTAPL